MLHTNVSPRFPHSNPHVLARSEPAQATYCTVGSVRPSVGLAHARSLSPDDARMTRTAVPATGTWPRLLWSCWQRRTTCSSPTKGVSGNCENRAGLQLRRVALRLYPRRRAAAGGWGGQQPRNDYNQRFWRGVLCRLNHGTQSSKCGLFACFYCGTQAGYSRDRNAHNGLSIPFSCQTKVLPVAMCYSRKFCRVCSAWCGFAAFGRSCARGSL